MSQQEPAAPAAAPAEAADSQAVAKRAAIANGIVKNYVIGSAVAGFVPLPIADMAAIALVQLKMLHSLANHYGVQFRSELAKSLVASLVGGVTAAGIGRGTLPSLLKAVPLVGPIAAAASLPAVAGAATYAVGQVFIQHFASGGTFLDFDPEKVRTYFAAQMEKGKTALSELRTA